MKKCKASVYIDAVNLTKLLYCRRVEMPKCDRYDMGRELFRLCHTLIASIAVVNSQKDYTERLREMDAELVPLWEQLKALISLAIDLDMFKPNTLVLIAEMLEKIDDGVYSWRSYIVRNVR